mmetsp:Transcript_13125/g.47150  ORF Transcript_13125/g.47150 Transcript_13125/m.47150 type:complete len:257 (-) Transcript_13125:56-826(-)
MRHVIPPRVLRVHRTQGRGRAGDHGTPGRAAHDAVQRSRQGKKHLALLGRVPGARPGRGTSVERARARGRGRRDTRELPKDPSLRRGRPERPAAHGIEDRVARLGDRRRGLPDRPSRDDDMLRSSFPGAVQRVAVRVRRARDARAVRVYASHRRGALGGALAREGDRDAVVRHRRRAVRRAQRGEGVVRALDHRRSVGGGDREVGRPGRGRRDRRGEDRPARVGGNSREDTDRDAPSGVGRQDRVSRDDRGDVAYT